MEEIQRQLSRGVLRKRCSENMQQIYRRTSMPKCDFNKVALRHGCSLGNLLHIFRTPFLKNTSRWLPLEIHNTSRVSYKFILYVQFKSSVYWGSGRKARTKLFSTILIMWFNVSNKARFTFLVLMIKYLDNKKSCRCFHKYLYYIKLHK